MKAPYGPRNNLPRLPSKREARTGPISQFGDLRTLGKGCSRCPESHRCFHIGASRARGIAPSAEADRRTLIRRVSLDLIGLPPTLIEVENFVADRRPDAFERVVDRLLQSPHYGEKWARHWLDLARYADSDGYEKDCPGRSPGAGGDG